MKEFATAAKAAIQPSDMLTFKYDGRVCQAKRPNEGQVALLIAAEANPLADQNEKIAGTINFALTIFSDETRRYFGNRLINSEHPDNIEYGRFEFEELMNVVQYVVEHFSENPTKSSSDSTSSPEDDGPTSTAGAERAVSTSSKRKQLTPAT